MIINLTPHKVTILDEDHNLIKEIEPSGLIARIEAAVKPLAASHDGVPLYETKLGSPKIVGPSGAEIGGFPAETQEIIYIVSGLFRSHFDRPDLYQPGELVRDDKGNIIGCIGLSR